MTSEMQNDRDPVKLLDHAAYLKDELTALKLVISAVPYKEKPLDEESIMEMIMMIDHAQTSYYNPVISRVFSDANPVLNDIEDFRVTFTPLPDNEDLHPDEIIEKVISNRLALMDKLNQIPIDDWERAATLNGKKTSITELLHDMIDFERKKLKEIAERVLVIDVSRSNPKPQQP